MYSQELRILRPNLLKRSFRDTTFFMTFSEIFKKNLDIKKFQNVEPLNPVIGICEGTLRGLRILPLNMVALVLVVFEI